MAFWQRRKKRTDQYDDQYDVLLDGDQYDDVLLDGDQYNNDQHNERSVRASRGKRSGRLKILPHALFLGLCGSLAVGAAGAGGKTMLEKSLTDLASPIGLLWLMLMLMVYFCLVHRQAWPATVGFCCWLVLTACGNSWVSGKLIQSLEAPFQDIDVLELEPMDVVVLLGGGTNTRLNGNPQLTFGGDRVRVGASLFHAELAERLVCSGSQAFGAGADDPHPGQEATEILVSLGVPRESVLLMTGFNTSQEMKSLKKLLADREIVDNQSPDLTSASEALQGQRIGLVTSAWHMSRALRLAEANGLEVIPVPADFLSEPLVPSPNWVIPGSYSLNVTGLVAKEYLARLVGR